MLQFVIAVALSSSPATLQNASLPRRLARPVRQPPAAGRPAPKAALERLARGHRRYRAGEFAAARRELQPLADAPLKSRDYALYLLAQSELLGGAPEPAIRHFRAVEKLGGRLGGLARFRAADALYAAGRIEEARRAYESALKHPAGDDVEPAVALFRIAEYRRLYLEHPRHPLAARALERLEALQPEAARFGPADRIARAKALGQSRDFALALEELAQVPVTAPPALRDEADALIGMALFRMRHNYSEAAAKLLAVWPRLGTEERRADALFHGSRALSRADRDDEAIAGYRQVVEKFPHSAKAAEASFLIGWLDFNHGRYRAARPELEETLRRFGSSPYAADARWYLGFSRWLEGDLAGALGDFDKLAARPGALTGGKGAYWKGRVLGKLGQSNEAWAVWRQVVTTYPFSYYALQARARLGEQGMRVGPFGERSQGVVPALGQADARLAADPEVARVDELLAAELTVEAGQELRRAEPELLRRYGAARILPLLFDRYARSSDFHRPHQLAESYAGDALKLDPHASAARHRWWEQAYPLAYRALIDKYAPSGSNPPYYLYTIMQKESAYNPHDVSYADAIGLLQMIPPTSRKVALRILHPYSDDVLYDPEGNIRFGAWYIGQLLAKFRGQIALGAGSYNAGPKAMIKWLERHGDRPFDEFVELCSYTQTREYMKKVLEIYARYLYLYQHEDYLPDATVNRAFVMNDIDY